MLSVGGRFGWDEAELAGGLTLHRAQLVVIFLIHLAVSVWLVAVLRRWASVSFLRGAAYGAALAALGSIVFSFAGVLFLSTCT